MASFHFINETEGISGRVKSSKARKVIRSVVMKRHWAVDSTNTPIKITQPKLQKTNVKELRVLPTIPKPNSNNQEDEDRIQQMQRTQAPSFQLNRAKDIFVYGGLSIDEQSLRYFSDHGIEC